MLSRRAIQMATLSFLVVGFIFSTTSAFAYWQEVTVSRDVELVTIGEPIEIIVTDVTEDFDVSLVPAGYALSVGDAEVVELTYEVGVSRELLNAVDLYVTATNVLINGEDTYSHLVDIEILGFKDSAVLDLYNDEITLVVQVRLLEPIDADEALDQGLDESMINVEDSVVAYEAIKGQNITFSLLLELQAKPETVSAD